MLRGTYKKSAARIHMHCNKCNKKFLAIRLTRKYCSALCRHRAVVPLLPKPDKKHCEKCNRFFQPLRAKTRFCSERCQANNWTSNNRSKYNKRMRELNYETRIKTPWLLPIRAAMYRARKDGFPCDLTVDWGKSRWTGRCEVSGLPFVILQKAPRTLFSPTIDRIDPKKGYTQNNSRFVLWGVNAFKQNGSDEDMFKIARAIAVNISRSD